MGKPLRLFFNWAQARYRPTPSRSVRPVVPIVDQTSSGARRWASRQLELAFVELLSAPASRIFSVLRAVRLRLCCAPSLRGCRTTHRTRCVRSRGRPAGWRCRNRRGSRARAGRTSCSSRCFWSVVAGIACHPRHPRAGTVAERWSRCRTAISHSSTIVADCRRTLCCLVANLARPAPRSRASPRRTPKRW